MPFALGVLIATGVETGMALYSRPGVQATIDSILKKVFTGKAEDDIRPEEVRKQVEQIIALFEANNLQPNHLAVDGVPR